MARLHLLFAGLALVPLSVGCAEERKSYMRHPLVRELRLMPAPVKVPDIATPAEPVPPPRPVLPDDPSTLVTAPTIRSDERTPAER